jgi:HEAT repeat protein
MRVKAVEALGGIADQRAVEWLIAALEDRDLREAAVDALGRIGASAVEPLVVSLSNRNYLVRRDAARALGEIGDSRAVEPLVGALKDRQNAVCQAAGDALGKIGGTLAVKLLIASLYDENHNVRQAAASALGEIGDSKAGEPLIATLTDTQRTVRRAAAAALVSIGSPAVDLLIAALSSGIRDVRQTAGETLGSLYRSRQLDRKSKLRILQQRERLASLHTDIRMRQHRDDPFGARRHPMDCAHLDETGGLTHSDQGPRIRL